MAINTAYDEIGRTFVHQYYAMFDNPATRPQLVNLYNVETSFMTFEGMQLQGSVKIMEKISVCFNVETEGAWRLTPFNLPLFILDELDKAKLDDTEEYLELYVIAVIVNVVLQSLTFQKINRIITAVDSQPMFDGGVLINVLGRLQTDDDPAHGYSHVFVLKPVGTAFYCAHDIFRLNIHDSG